MATSLSSVPSTAAHEFEVAAGTRKFRLPGPLPHLFVALLVFLGLLLVFNGLYFLLGNAGVLRAESGAISLGMNATHVAAQANKYGGFLREVAVDPQVAVSVVMAILLVGLIHLLPSYLNLRVSRLTVKVLTWEGALYRQGLLQGVDLLARALLTLFVAVLGISLLAFMLDGGNLLENFTTYYATWLQAVSFNSEQTVIQAAFYSALYVRRI